MLKVLSRGRKERPLAAYAVQAYSMEHVPQGSTSSVRGSLGMVLGVSCRDMMPQCPTTSFLTPGEAQLGVYMPLSTSDAKK